MRRTNGTREESNIVCLSSGRKSTITHISNGLTGQCEYLYEVNLSDRITL